MADSLLNGCGIKSDQPARVAKLADARDLKSRVLNRTYRFNSGPGHQTEPAQRSKLGSIPSGDGTSMSFRFCCTFRATMPKLCPMSDARDFSSAFRSSHRLNF